MELYNLKSSINKYITDQKINKAVHLQINSLIKEIVNDLKMEMTSDDISNKYLSIIPEKKCCYLKTNGSRCSKTIHTKDNFCKIHLKHEKSITSFLNPIKESISILEINFEKTTKIINYTDYKKVFINDNFCYIKDDIIHDKDLDIIGFIKNNEYVFEFDPFL